MGLVAAHVVVVVDEADFYHDSGHGRVAQDEEARPLFHPPVGQVEDGLDVGLDAVAQEQALGCIGNECFRARSPLIEGVEMKGASAALACPQTAYKSSDWPRTTATPFRSK